MIIVVLSRTWMIGSELGNKHVVKNVVSATAGRRNRFLCGRNRVPGIISREEESMCLRNQLLMGRNGASRVNFSKKTILNEGTGYLLGGTEFLVHFPKSVFSHSVGTGFSQ